MNCSKLRRLIADGGPAALAGIQEAEDHLVDCAECLAVLEAMTEIDALLPVLEGHDAADEVVEQLLSRSELHQPSDEPKTMPVGAAAKLKAAVAALASALSQIEPAKRLGSFLDRARRARLRWGIVAVPAVLLIGVVSVLTMRSFDGPETSVAPYVVKQVKTKQKPGETATLDSIEESERQTGRVDGSGGEAGADRDGGRNVVLVPMKKEIKTEVVSDPASPVEDAPVLAYPAVADSPRSAHEGPSRSKTEDEEVSDERIEEAMERSFEGDVTVTGSVIPKADLNAVAAPVDSRSERVAAGLEPLESNESETGGFKNKRTHPSSDDDLSVVSKTEDHGEEAKQRRLGQSQYLESGRDSGREETQSMNQENRANNEEFRHKLSALEQQAEQFRELGDKESAQQLEAQLEVLKGQYEAVTGKDYVGGASDGVEDRELGAGSSVTRGGEIDAAATEVAREYLEARTEIEDLDYVEARGYWANTYVPGDRTLRRLKARLDRADGVGVTGVLHDDARQISQPFDAPETAALAVYLHGDRTGVETRERMLVQIGLKATSRRAGIRPAMNIGLVLDLRGQVGAEEATAIRALLQSFASASELGDRFSLTVAGRPGGTILPPGDLRHGPLTVAMGELFGDDASGTALSLEQAVGTALAAVRADEDPNEALGSSALVVITSQELGGLTGRLTHMAHLSAVDGVPWSAIGVGESVDLAELDALVLAGQGNRRLLTAAVDAESLVDRELAAVSRAVARAVRLRIRLAPGVQLVDVIGSHRLDDHHAQQVRDAEQSIDQRLSRTLGIQADRGLDEEGIQIVIPSYYADNAHVVLLDVVVPGPGPVADVTVRYKDLVHMKNGLVRAHLEVGRTGTAAGPLERNVLANLIATEVASSLDRAADAVAVGDIQAAREILGEALDLVRGITILVDGLAQNPDLEADIRMLTGYLDALAILPDGDRPQLQTAADSLRYAGRLKILPPPADDHND